MVLTPSDLCGRPGKWSAAAWTLGAWIIGLALIAAPTAAKAHNAVATGENAQKFHGLEIPAITHSDMGVVSRYYLAIISLAERQTTTDERLRRLMNYAKIQYTYCLWGVVPGAITDESSAFNRCSHAYLAASWTLLQHLETRPAARMSAAAILQSIEADRAASPFSVLCQNSAETFHTDEFIVPAGPIICWMISTVVLAAGCWLALRAWSARAPRADAYPERLQGN